MTIKGKGVFAGQATFREAKPKELKAHVESVRGSVIPKIKEQLKRKQVGADRVKACKVS